MKKILAKKLGEVCAFAKVSVDTYSKGEEALTKVFDQAYLTEIKQVNEDVLAKFQELMQLQEHESLFAAYSQASENKILHMRKIYLEEKWDRADEILEWLGFIEGSAAVHWSLVEELAKESDLSKIDSIAGNMQSFHTRLLQKITEAIKNSE